MVQQQRSRRRTGTAVVVLVVALVGALATGLLGVRSVAALAGGSPRVADGELPDGVTVFDHRYPGVTELDAELLGALRRAGRAAARDGIDIEVNSGWRSAAYQQRLLDEAIAEHGSAAEAARWVSTPDTSAHVAGEAVDLGPAQATAWLTRYGARYGLCQIYANEPWHYELRPSAGRHGCPELYADAAHDPRHHVGVRR